MSSSGPLSIAIKHRKPFLLSEVIAPYTETADFSASIQENGFEDSYPVLDLNRNIFKQIHHLRDKEKIQPLRKISEDLYNSRMWERVGERYVEVMR
jgi:hypothetical protein